MYIVQLARIAYPPPPITVTMATLVVIDDHNRYAMFSAPHFSDTK